MSNIDLLPNKQLYVLPPSYREQPSAQVESQTPRYLRICQHIGAAMTVLGLGGVAAGEVSGMDDPNLMTGALSVGAVGAAIVLITESAKNVIRNRH